MVTEAALIRRFEPDYRVMTADSPSTGLAMLERPGDVGAVGERRRGRRADCRRSAAARYGRRGVLGTSSRATPGCQPRVVAGDGSISHPDSLHRVGDIAVGNRAGTDPPNRSPAWSTRPQHASRPTRRSQDQGLQRPLPVDQQGPAGFQLRESDAATLRRPPRRWQGRARCRLLRSDAADLDAVFPCLAISLPRCRRSRMQSID